MSDSKIARKRKKLLFVISSLAGGGAERVITNIISYLDYKNYEISLALFEKKGPYLSQIPDYVKVYDLKKKSRYSFLNLIFRLSRLYRKLRPNTVTSFLAYTNIVALLAKLLSRVRFNLIISTRTYLSYAVLHTRFRRIKYLLYKFLFKHADFIVVPSIDIKKDLEKKFNITNGNIRVIYNPIDLKKITKLKEEEVEDLKIKGCKSFILTVGRLIDQKGYTYLLMAYSRIYKIISEKFVILGAGEDQEKLKSLANDLGIREHVFFWGFQKNPYKFMNKASIFVLSSLLDGFPNVILEALACGVPVISTDCTFGPNEIITNGKNSIVVPPGDEKALANAMLTLLRDEDLRKQLSEEGRKRAEDFSIEKILPQYEELF